MKFSKIPENLQAQLREFQLNTEKPDARTAVQWQNTPGHRLGYARPKIHKISSWQGETEP